MIREHAGSVTVDLLVQPRATRAKVGPVHDGRLKVAVIELVAKQLGVARGAIEVISGAASRRKTLRISGVTAAAVEGLVG